METTKRNWALITGGSMGIGYELAQLFAKDGYNLILVARTQEDLDRAKKDLQNGNNIEVETISKNLFEVNASQEIYDEVKRRGHQVSILVNDAGQGEYGFFNEIDMQRDIDIINLNVMAPVLLTKLFLKDMIANKQGKILNLASIVSKNPSPLLTIYSATKAFIYSFSMALRNELKDTGVSVTALLPGSTDTDFFSKAGMLNTKEVNEYELSDPKGVAKAGYDALMDDEEKVVAEGMKNKMMANMANVMPDSMITENMRKNHMQNVDGTEGKRGASESEGTGMRQAASGPSSTDDNPREER